VPGRRRFDHTLKWIEFAEAPKSVNLSREAHLEPGCYRNVKYGFESHRSNMEGIDARKEEETVPV
jgi:hypothetical protein